MFVKNLPLILSLLAGFVVCVATYIYQYSDTSWLWIVLGAIVLFYILGVCLRRLFTVILSENEQEDDTTDEEDEEMETEAEEEEDTEE